MPHKAGNAPTNADIQTRWHRCATQPNDLPPCPASSAVTGAANGTTPLGCQARCCSSATSTGL